MTMTQAQTTRTWHVDTEHSSATFAVRNVGRVVTGIVPIRRGFARTADDGSIIDAQGVAELGAIDTGNTRRDTDLRKPSLLDLDRHPLARFDAERVVATDSGWRVTGRLVARGTATRVTFDLTTEPAADGGVVATGTCAFDRRELGLRAPRLLIGRMITITIRAHLRASE